MLTPHPANKTRGKQLASGRHCQASGTGITGGTAGVACVLSVRCKDRHTVPLTQGGDVVLVSMTPQDGSGPSVDAHVIDNTDGSYTCTYLPVTASQNCRVAVTVNGTHLNGSPYFAQVVPGKTDSKCSEVFGRGLYDGMSGQPCKFTVQTKDAYGNRCSKPGGKFVVSVKPLQSLVHELEQYLRKVEVHAQVLDKEDGSHDVEFQVDYAGFYSVEVKGGCPLPPTKKAPPSLGQCALASLPPCPPPSLLPLRPPSLLKFPPTHTV